MDEVLIVVTHILAFEGEKPYILKEEEIREEINEEKIRFFHSGFQSKTGTLSRILKEEAGKNIRVIFHEVPREIVPDIMEHIIKETGFEKTIFSSRRN